VTAFHSLGDLPECRIKDIIPEKSQQDWDTSVPPSLPERKSCTSATSCSNCQEGHDETPSAGPSGRPRAEVAAVPQIDNELLGGQSELDGIGSPCRRSNQALPLGYAPKPLSGVVGGVHQVAVQEITGDLTVVADSPDPPLRVLPMAQR